MEILYWSTLVLFLLVCVFLILLVLIQKGRGGGLAGAFGGAGGNTAFGSKTGDVLTWATSILFGVFLLLAVATNWLSNSIDATRYPQASAATTAGPTSPARPRGAPGGQAGVPHTTGEPTDVGEEPAFPGPAAPAPAPAPTPRGGASAAPGGSVVPPAAPAAPTSQPAR
jgi:preprotein translocase subunit SecG